MWHQGEQDQGSGGPDGDYDYKSYQQYFVDMSAAWKQDYPNIKNYYIFQIWPNACGDVSRNDLLREVQRTLPYLYSNMRIMTTVGVVPGSSCHYEPAGYQKFSDFMSPLVKQDNYGYMPAGVFTAPDLKKAYFTTSAHNEIALEFGQDMAWNTGVPSLIFLDGVAGKAASGSASGKVIKLQLSAASTAQKITYLQGTAWNGVQGNLLYGTNGIAALTFAEVALTLPSPTGLAAIQNNNQVAVSWSASAAASGYKVKRSLTSGGPYSVIGSPTGTTFTDTAVTNGTTYFYVASATNGTDESLNSTEVSVTLTVIGTGVTSTTLVRHPGTDSSSSYGDALSFDVTVSGSSTPTGIVTLKDNGAAGTVIGTGILAGGNCTITPALTALLPGSHSNLVAVYSGDVDFAASTSSALSTQTVSTKALTVTGAVVTSKTYDGTLSAAVSGGTLNGVVGSDPVTLGNNTSGTFNTKDVGTAKPVGTAMTISGTSVEYYTLTQPALTGTITAKPLTVSGTTVTSKTYDGSTAATLSGGTLAGVIGTDTVTLLASGTFNTKDVGTGKAVTSTSTLGGAQKDNYTLTQPTGLTGTITALVATLGGSRTYDGTTTVAAGALSVSNKIIGDDVTLTGSGMLAGKHAGSQAIVAGYVTPLRVRAAKGNTASNAATSFTVNMGTAPANGNTLIAVIATRGTSSGRVTGMTQTGATWSRAVQTSGTAGTTTEIWFASNVSGAGAVVTINQNSTRSAAVITEYSGILSVSPVDQTANTYGSSTAAVTGTTPITTQTSEVWIGGIGYNSSAPTLGTIPNSFSAIDNSQSASSTAANNARVYALERIVNATASANSGGTLSVSAQWSGAIATFKAASTLQLAGAAAGNYTLIGAGGSVTINKLACTLTAVTATKTYDGTITAAGTPTLTPALVSGDTITTRSQAFETAIAGTGNKVIIPGITINDGNGGANYAVTLVNCTTGTINKAPATITLGNLTPTYDGTPKPVSVTTDPTELAVDLTYNGSATAPANAGSYLVVATINNANFAGTANGILVIVQESIAEWQAGHFTANEITEGLALDDADPDGDGITNRDEYALGTDPRVATTQVLTLQPAANGTFTLRFRALRADGPGYAGRTRTYDVECSSDLTNPSAWQAVPGHTDMVGRDPADDMVIITLPVDALQQFYRLNVRVE